MKPFDLGEYIARNYHSVEDAKSLRVWGAFFAWLQDKRDQWIEVVYDAEKLPYGKVLFDGIVEDHGDLLCMVRFSEDDLVSCKVHPCWFKHFQYLCTQELDCQG